MLLGWVCPVCDEPGLVPCERCRAEMRAAPSLPTPPLLDHCLALLAYEGAARELVARVKFRNQRAAINWLADGMAGLLDDSLAAQLELVTWAPATPLHARRRGFDHGELLARAVARRLRIDCARVLARAAGPALTGRAAADRRSTGVALTARRCPTSPCLVVDDVVTTGTTMSSAAAALRAAGVTSVVGLAAARTPRPAAGPVR
ncbi:MAG TPA: phosphoribosyltransferase family protein [Acidimicrobiales bacterium]|nr:phosphoribosyltransferase family protein [Acidimicrobiales bacterium]